MWKWTSLALILTGGVSGAQVPGTLAPPLIVPHGEPRLYAVTTDGGGLVGVFGGPPWIARTESSTASGRILRAFGEDLYAVDPAAGAIWRVPRRGEGDPEAFHLGPFSDPQDVFVLRRRGTALVTRRFESKLLRIDLESGTISPSVDLAPLATGGEDIALGTMERDGYRLFVQVTLTDPLPVDAPSFPDRGVLAVIDLRTHALIDVDPGLPGVQGVELQGAPPHLKMQIVDRTLFVSASNSRLDERGGIEMVDLDTLASIGFALSEKDDLISDIGGFVMITATEGYFVFHTDIVPSTHLKPFSIADGVRPGPETFFLLGDVVDDIVYDPKTHRIFIPSGLAGFGLTPGIYVVNARTDRLVELNPIDTGMQPRGIVLVD